MFKPITGNLTRDKKTIGNLNNAASEEQDRRFIRRAFRWFSDFIVVFTVYRIPFSILVITGITKLDPFLRFRDLPSVLVFTYLTAATCLLPVAKYVFSRYRISREKLYFLLFFAGWLTDTFVFTFFLTKPPMLHSMLLLATSLLVGIYAIRANQNRNLIW